MPWIPQTPQAPLPSHIYKSPTGSYFSPLFAQSTGPAPPTSTAPPSHPPPSFSHHKGGDAGSLCDGSIVAEDQCVEKDKDKATKRVPPFAEPGPGPGLGWEQMLLDEARRFDPRITALRDIECVFRPNGNKEEDGNNGHGDVRIGSGGGGGSSSSSADAIKIPKDDMGRLILLVKKDCTIGYNAGGSEAFDAEEGVVVAARAMPFVQVEGNLRMQITGGPQRKVKKRKRGAEDDGDEECRDGDMDGTGNRDKNDGDGDGDRGAVYGVPVCDAPRTRRPAKRVRVAARRNLRRQAA
ncbi:hypothetical protein F4811DRAFT_369565 [Daldinia bambusicola]|nr:hypothetical protein F4811DRAFT_369565 [Daldinia bambusicola]